MNRARRPNETIACRPPISLVTQPLFSLLLCHDTEQITLAGKCLFRSLIFGVFTARIKLFKPVPWAPSRAKVARPRWNIQIRCLSISLSLPVAAIQRLEQSRGNSIRPPRIDFPPHPFSRLAQQRLCSPRNHCLIKKAAIRRTMAPPPRS